MSSAHADAYPTAPGHAEGAPRKREKKKQQDEKAVEVSINSLLDVLSVILMFLMKSYSATTVQIKPSKDLQVPNSYSSLPVEQSTAITVTLNSILIDDKPVAVTFSDDPNKPGEIAEQDTSNAGMMIDPVFNRLQEVVAHLKRVENKNPDAKFKGVITIIADRRVPAPLIQQVMYTAGQAEYNTFKFAAIQTSR